MCLSSTFLAPIQLGYKILLCICTHSCCWAFPLALTLVYLHHSCCWAFSYALTLVYLHPQLLLGSFPCFDSCVSAPQLLLFSFPCFDSEARVPAGSPSRRGDVTVDVWHTPAELALSFLFCTCVNFCLYGPFNCISFHKFSRQLSVFSLCSFGLISALLVLSIINLFMKVSLSPDNIICGWLGLKHQLSNHLALKSKGRSLNHNTRIHFKYGNMYHRDGH